MSRLTFHCFNIKMYYKDIAYLINTIEGEMNKLKLTETTVSLTKNKLLIKLKKHKYKPPAILAVLILCAVGLIVRTNIVTENSDTIESENSASDYAMRLPHYSSFDMSDVKVAVKINSVYNDIYLQNNTAQIQYSAQVYPITLKDFSITWSNGNDIIANIDENGLVTAYVPGTTDITATLIWQDETHTASSKLNIIQPVEGMYMPTTTITLYKGGTGQMLMAAVSPANATNQNITWQSKDDKVAVVDETGYVTPVDTGMTEVVATSEDGSFTSKCFVNVVNYSVKVDNVSIQNSGKDDSYLKVGESFTVLAAVQPSNAKDKTLKWTSTNSDVASVSQTGVVRALKVGETYINVSSSNGKQDTLKLTVQPSDTANTDVLDLSGSTNAATADIINGSVTYSTYSNTLDEMVNIQMGLNPPPKYNGSNYASSDQVRRWMDPSSFSTGAYKYQFLDLSRPNGTTEEALNSYLSNKGILAGHASDFIAAANEYGVSEIYLIAHACLETGNGTSQLARGVEVNGTTVYNVFGIGAYDNSAVYSGSQKAYREGWTSVNSAIRGGAQWISQYYINSEDGRQNTLYKMLWNPENPGQHQYATDIEWATKQAVNIEKIFEMFPDAVKTYDVPVYSGENPAVLDVD